MPYAAIAKSIAAYYKEVSRARIRRCMTITLC